MRKNVTILDTTLRDGSYAAKFQFTAQDTAVISRALEDVGVELIEIGHGVGLRASQKGCGEAAATDEEYFAAAGKVLSKAKYGMFCIPGIAELEDVDMAADMGAGFIRIGTNVADVRASEPFVRRAKKRGLFVSANYMKSYTMPPAEFAQLAKLTQNYGADILCVVDSAGGMLDADVRYYFEAVREICDIELGFHGHNNLGLAVAHSLLAVELGASIVDASLQGYGRSSGNASTEQVAAALDRMGVATGIDLLRLMDVGEQFIRPMVLNRGLPSLDTVMGYALFHSSYMGVIRKYASKEGVDPRRVIIELCKRDKVNAPEELVASIAASIGEKTEQPLTSRFSFTSYYGNEQNGK